MSLMKRIKSFGSSLPLNENNKILKESSAFAIKLDSYLDKSGKFDYSKYRDIQVQGNKSKIENIWVLEENIQFLADYIRKKNKTVEFGICHGTRRGKEQEWFHKYLGCEIIGTEISDTAKDYPNTIQWDFHDVKEEWLNRVDFIYSNSFDHSYDPEMCINQWISCLKPGGMCILEHSDFHGVQGVDELDPFGAELMIMPYLILSWGGGKFAITEILKATTKGSSVKELVFLIITRQS